MRLTAFACALLLSASVTAQEAPSFPQTDLVQVQIDGQLNVRSGPSTEAPRVTRVASGEILRRVACEATTEDEAWCEIEFIDGSLEGWASARFLTPWYGADPAVLDTPVIAAAKTFDMGRASDLSGTLAQGETIDVQVKVAAEADAQISLDAPDGFGLAVFEPSGKKIDASKTAEDLDVMLMKAGTLTIRIADLGGTGGAWTLTVQRN